MDGVLHRVTVTDGDPRQYKFRFALWTSKMIGEVIFKKFGIKLSKASVCRLLGQLGLSAQRPLWRAYQQNPEIVDRWLREVFPEIEKRAKRRRAAIWFGDEAGIRSDAHAGTTWGKRGQTPIISSTGARFGMNLISAVNRQGGFRFMCVSGRVNAEVFIEFLKRLLHNADKPVFLIVDGHPSHKAKKVREFVTSVSPRLELYFLPPYSPELNPDELVWNDLKNNCVGRQAHSGSSQLKSSVMSYMRYLQKTPARIATYFLAPTTRYAAGL